MDATSYLKEKRKRNGTQTLINTIIILGISAIIALFAAQPYFEAKSFNKLTGGNATYWDALWSNLRIDGSSQQRDGDGS